eukprot:6179933-Pleurochrysis_carterae.AAC.1
MHTPALLRERMHKRSDRSMHERARARHVACALLLRATFDGDAVVARAVPFVAASSEPRRSAQLAPPPPPYALSRSLLTLAAA